ncbi:lipoprotein Hlp [Actinobacillus equuli]|uniref:lipoprotein Hlp n=1 Tax=Actinobacillus equuli TaxID=718 RepID=UPI002442305F|nr:lipoprotein Hlp [Actinobacillus equuli]WGE49649.1 lipoprotein Hlp [Actinobacillus equuli subsp. equuli]
MNKFTKISAAALFAFFLSACDKPANKTADTSATQTETKTTAVDTGAQDYKKFQEWQQLQEKSIGEAINSAIEKLGDKAKDAALIQTTMNKAILEQIENIQKSAATLEIKDPQVKVLKDKSLEAMALGAKMIAENDKLAKNPTPEAHKAFGELQAQLDKIAMEGQKIEAELATKYGAAPAPAPAPAQ